ncbi:cupin domain-containing protein [Chelativorans sp. SCAU2101]|uniref:Cupin domain-containing protein n=1 Tax=Chelativorans petroleitrophicus TaxID=2975484 RepID=A0A9X3B0K2_9HYPH|nr:cupin domain-containing protein [Chelativorans petroleitrophicus]MCT8991579.1 cupin domain-containing protein [Chelativorans petroleitrophicus]
MAWCRLQDHSPPQGKRRDHRLSGVFSPPGSGPPQHIHHREDENFVLHSGRYGFWLDGDIAPKGSGETVFVPRGREHTYRVARTVPSRHLTVLTPGGLEASSKPWRLMGTAFPKTCRPSRHGPYAST